MYALYIQIPLSSCVFDLSVYKTKVIQLCTIIQYTIVASLYGTTVKTSHANFDLLFEIQNIMTPLLFLIKTAHNFLLVDK